MQASILMMLKRPLDAPLMHGGGGGGGDGGHMTRKACSQRSGEVAGRVVMQVCDAVLIEYVCPPVLCI